METPDARLDAGDELDSGRAGADHRDALSTEVVVVVPGGGVEQRALERFEAGDVGDRGLAQSPKPAHQHVGAKRAARGVEPPAPRALVPIRAGYLVAEPDVGHHAEVPGAAA